jgi:hypothetical protein
MSGSGDVGGASKQLIVLSRVDEMKTRSRSRSAMSKLRVLPLTLVMAEPSPRLFATESASVTHASAQVHNPDEIPLAPSGTVREARGARYEEAENNFAAAEAIVVDNSGKWRGQSVYRCASVNGCASRL